MGRTPRDRPLGIFCVEGSWSEKLTDRSSVRELLEILEDVAGIEFIHHRVETPDGLTRSSAGGARSSTPATPSATSRSTGSREASGWVVTSSHSRSWEKS